MSLNVENLFIKCEDPARIARLVEDYWRDRSQPVQPDWGLPSSFELLLAKDPRRKAAISPPQKGWVALVESEEVVDFALAKVLSERLATAALVIQVSEATGAAGHAYAVGGVLLERYFSDEDDDPLGTVRSALKRYGVPFDPILFKEAFQGGTDAWSVVQWRQ